MRLESQDLSRCYVPQSGSVRALLYVGVEAARSILKILAALQTQGLLGMIPRHGSHRRC